jgi:hypothetical protein
MATYTITITQVPSGSGLVKVGSSTVAGNVQEEGVTVNLLATAFSGFTFINYVVGGDVVSTSNSYSFVMPSNNIEIIVNFATVVPPDITEQPEIYDTDCPKFYFIKDLTERYFTGDLVDLSASNFVEIEEPIDFDTGKFRLERDPNYHGFNYEFAVDELKYEFDSAGYNYLKDELYLGGTDSDIKFVYGYGNIASFTIFYIGKVDMNTYAEIENGEKITFGLVELDFDNLLQTAFEVVQSTPADRDLLLYSKVIPKKVTYTVPKRDSVLQDDSLAFVYFEDPDYFPLTIDSAGTQYIFFNDGREGDDIDLFVTYDFQIENLNPFTEGAGLKYLFRAKEAGKYKIGVKATFRLYLSAINSDPFQQTFDFVRLIIQRTAPDGVELLQAPVSVAGEVLNDPTSDPFVDIEFTLDSSFTIDLEECIYLFINIQAIPEDTEITDIAVAPYRGNDKQPQIVVVAETLTEGSLTKCIAPLDLLESTISKSADTDYQTVISDFFDEGGCGNKLSILNGFGVRSADLDERSFIKVSAKKLVDGLQSLFCLGWGVEYNDIKQEVVRIEPVEHFYKDVEIMTFNNVSDYSLTVDPSIYYNEIEIGFSKYSKTREKDKGNTIDDFHTKHLYQTPIKTNKNKLSVLTDITLSGYEIELLRRKQFEKKGEDENANFREDEELFGVQLLNYVPFSGVTSTGVLTDLSEGDIIKLDNLSIILVGYVPFFKGQPINVNVDSQGDVKTSILNIQYGQFTPQGFSFSVLGTLIRFTSEIDSPVNAPFSQTVIISTLNGLSYLVPESTQAHETFENIISPETSYNLRYTPKRMLYQWAKLFNGGFFTKAGTDQVVFKQGDGNTSLITKFAESEECLLGDVGRLTLGEGDNLDISVLNGDGSYLFLPIKISFSTNLSFEQLTDLKKCLRGQDDSESDRNYGYISVADYCGQLQKLFITSIEYSGVTEEATIEGYLKEL